MKFIIEYIDITEPKKIVYDIKECSFDTEPAIHEINYDIVVNKLNLTVVNDNRIVQLWGFCGYNEWIKSNYDVPLRKAGFLKVLDDLEYGFAYKITENNLPVFVNTQTGWVCIGDPEGSGSAVEFIKNCVAVIGNDNEFISLWLKPQSLPDI
jgi:hypothetical protein